MTAIDAFDNDYPIHGACKDVIAQTAYINRDITEGTGWACVESAVMVPVLPYGLRGAMLSGGHQCSRIDITARFQRSGFMTNSSLNRTGSRWKINGFGRRLPVIAPFSGTRAPGVFA